MSEVKKETGTTSTKSGATQQARQASARQNATEQDFQSPLDELEQGPPELMMIRDWIRENQTVAMVGAFAAGTLIGYLMRD